MKYLDRGTDIEADGSIELPEGALIYGSFDYEKKGGRRVTHILYLEPQIQATREATDITYTSDNRLRDPVEKV